MNLMPPQKRPPVQLRDFTPADQPVFRRLNEEWISCYFQLEPADLKALDHPMRYIIEPGGCILLAEQAGEVVGTCALIRMDAQSYELAKMAVAPAAQGQGIGWLLGKAAIQRTRDLGAGRLYLESNSILTTALQLYHKLGFELLPQAVPSPYARADVQMELWLCDTV